VATLLRALAEKANSAVGKAERSVSPKCQSARGAGDRADQSHPTRLGELLCGRRFESMLFVCQRLGTEEGSAASDASPGARWLRLETVEYEVAIRAAGTLSRLPASTSLVTPESAASRTCLITLDAKQAGKPIAGNRHDGFEVAETGNRLMVRILRHSQRKRGAPARLNLRSPAPVFDPTRPRRVPYKTLEERFYKYRYCPQIFMLLSRLPDAITLPLGAKATQETRL
jgi:hypothetical protein